MYVCMLLCALVFCGCWCLFVNQKFSLFLYEICCELFVIVGERESTTTATERYLTFCRAPNVAENCRDRTHTRSGTCAPARACVCSCRSWCNRSNCRPDSLSDPEDLCYRLADMDPYLQPLMRTRWFQTLLS